MINAYPCKIETGLDAGCTPRLGVWGIADLIVDVRWVWRDKVAPRADGTSSSWLPVCVRLVHVHLGCICQGAMFEVS